MMKLQHLHAGLKSLLSFFIIAFCICVISNAQVSTEDSAHKYLVSRGEVYFKFLAGNTDIEKISRIISVDYLKHDTIFAYANQKEFAAFTKLKLPYEVLRPPSLRMGNQKTANSLTELKTWDSYPSYSLYLDQMESFANLHPTLCKIVEIDTTIEGRKLVIAKISDNVNVKEAEPEFLFTSSIHGDELTGYMLCLRLIDYLLSNYGTDPLVTRLVDSVEIWINPLANPDGTYAGGNNSVTGATRYNAYSVDLNRNFPDPEDGQHPDGEEWQQETKAMMNFMHSHNFIFSANYHGGAEVLNYPWDTWEKRHADDVWFQHISINYADTVKKYGGTDYFSDIDPSGITNGYDWYTISGGRQDYMTYFCHGREITIEVSEIKMPPAASQPDYWEYNHAAMLHYIENCLYGIRGVITDSATHEPVRALISIAGYDMDSSQVYSDATNGNYHRMLNPGTYNLLFKSPGFKDKNIEGVVLTSFSSVVWLNVEMAKGSTPVSEEKEIQSEFNYFLDNNFNLFVDLPVEGKLGISIYELSGRSMLQKDIYYLSGRQQIDISTLCSTNGMYIIRLEFLGETHTLKYGIP
jgi:hypothetical protein